MKKGASENISEFITVSIKIWESVIDKIQELTFKYTMAN